MHKDDETKLFQDSLDEIKLKAYISQQLVKQKTVRNIVKTKPKQHKQQRKTIPQNPTELV